MGGWGGRRAGCKGALTPGGGDIGKDDRDIDRELKYTDAKLAQAAAGLEQHIALDRPDIAYSVKTALQQTKPTKFMQLRVVGVARYLKNNPRLVWKFPYQQQPKSIDVFVDADFAARETMLRSTSGVTEYYRKAPIELASSTLVQNCPCPDPKPSYSTALIHTLHDERFSRGSPGSSVLNNQHPE